MGKKKIGKKQPTAVQEDDDWDAILEAEGALNTTTDSALKQEEVKAEPSANEPDQKEDGGGIQDAAAAFLAAQGITTADEHGKKDKKKKKKKPKAAGGAEEKGKPEKVSAMGKLAAERLRKEQEERARIAAEEEAERQRIAAEEAAEAEALRLKEEEKERKRKAKADRIAKQKAEGTYMTPAQRAKAKQTQLRLEAMRAAGMKVPSGDDVAKEKVVYDNKMTRRKGKGRGKFQQSDEPKQDADYEKEESGDDAAEEAVEFQKKEEEIVPEPPKQQEEKEEPKKKEVSDGDDWEDKDESSGDEWDADSDVENVDEKFEVLAKRLQSVNTENDDVDLMEQEKRAEQERLRELGKKRAEQERIEAEKLAKLQAQAEEENRKLVMKQQLREEGRRKREELEKANLAARSPDDLRCPIVVIMGHVDTGKTKLLDKIRKTNVQEGEAGGITQQIGATFFEKSTLEAQTARLNATDLFDLKLPGMLVIDTPGHESFANLRSRGSSLCDIAILVVDLMHGLEQQTLESLNMLRKRGVPFVIALNKVDRCYGWKTHKDEPIRNALRDQDDGTMSEFRSRCTSVKVQLQEQGVNSNLYWEMGDDDWKNSDFVPLVPTSAVTGEGVPDLLRLLCQMSQYKLVESLMWHANLQCTVLEVKAIDGLGMTVDVLVVNGYLREGDRAVFCTLDGPIVTEIRGLLTPPPSREMRIKSEYLHHKQVKGALGVKLIGNNLDKVMAGTPVMVVGPHDEEEDIKAEVMSDLTKLEAKLSTDKAGVLVQASTLGALEALLQFLREDTQPPIPVSAIGIGTIHKRDVTKISIMNEKGHPEYATILAFDVNVEREAREHAEEMSVRIFTADIIYHLFDQFTRFMDDLNERRRAEASAVAVFPSVIKILPQHIFNQKDPIVFGAEVVEGILKVGTPLCVPALGGLFVGKVESIESNGRPQDTARKGTSVAVKVVNESNPTITYGRQFDATNMLYSQLSRTSIDALKAHFKDQLEDADWRLVVKLKKVFNIL